MQYRQTIQRIIEAYEGREIYLCQRSGIGGTRINLNPGNVSFCHEMELPDIPQEVLHIADCREISLAVYYEAVYRVLSLFQDPAYPCRGCPQCKKVKYSFEKLKLVTICTCLYCGNRCVYCNSHSMNERYKQMAWNPNLVLDSFREADLIDADCLFDWGGGEPTDNPYFEETVNHLFSVGFRQRINTNAIAFSTAVWNALRDRRATLRISVDSGTDFGYYRVKGTDNGRVVWNHIQQYCASGGEVKIKYNVFNLNSDDAEINGFLDRCRQTGVKCIIIDAEISSFQSRNNYGPFYFTEKELTAAHAICGKAGEAGIRTEISSYAFGSRSKGTKICLPTEYTDNIDHSVISSGIYLRAYADADLMRNDMTGRKEPVIIFGAGHIGSMAERILRESGVRYMIVDNDGSKTHLNGERVFLPREVFVDPMKKYTIILAIDNFKDVLKQINDMRIAGEVVWAKRQVYEEYFVQTHPQNEEPK